MKMVNCSFQEKVFKHLRVMLETASIHKERSYSEGKALSLRGNLYSSHRPWTPTLKANLYLKWRSVSHILDSVYSSFLFLLVGYASHSPGYPVQVHEELELVVYLIANQLIHTFGQFRVSHFHPFPQSCACAVDPSRSLWA